MQTKGGTQIIPVALLASKNVVTKKLLCISNVILYNYNYSIHIILSTEKATDYKFTNRICAFTSYIYPMGPLCDKTTIKYNSYLFCCVIVILEQSTDTGAYKKIL